MKKAILTLFIYIVIHSSLFINNCAAQSGWVWQNPLPQGNSLSSVKFINALTGVSVGASGTVLLSNDGGLNWIIISPKRVSKINAVCVLDSVTFIAAGDSGTILKSTNLGNNWSILNSGSSNELNTVSFVNSQTGFVAGRNVILKTTNGGGSWFSPNNSINHPVEVLFFVDENTGWMTWSYFSGLGCLISNELFKTTNGGLNWSIQFQLCYNNIVFISLFFINSNTGWCSPYYKTTNGGANWFLQSPSGKSVFFTNENFGWKISYSQGIIYKTTDGGNNWFARNSNALTELNSMFFTDTQTGWGVGQYGTTIKTIDGGENWFTISSGFYHDITSLSFLDSNSGWAGCVKGSILKTTNSGINWQSYFTGDSSDINQIYFVTPNVGYAVNWGGKILKTTNGGVNWFFVFTGGYIPRSVFFVDTNIGWVGDLGAFYKTTNGGLTWTTAYYNSMSWVNGLYFLNSNTGWAVGDYILKTTNGGTSWAVQNTANGGVFSSVFFISENIGWVNNQGYNIYKTTNGGANWLGVYPNNKNLSSIYFIDTLKGIAVGGQSSMGPDIILKTIDGGNNWSQVQIMSSEQKWASVYFSSQYKGWVAGIGGAILRTINFDWVPIGIRIETSEVPTTYELYQNYPNPFNPTTKIKFDIPAVGTVPRTVHLTVYDILGREVTTLVNEALKPGTYEAEWDARNFASGLYFYKLQAGDYVETKKMVLIK